MEKKSLEKVLPEIKISRFGVKKPSKIFEPIPAGKNIDNFFNPKSLIFTKIPISKLFFSLLEGINESKVKQKKIDKLEKIYQKFFKEKKITDEDLDNMSEEEIKNLKRELEIYIKKYMSELKKDDNQNKE